MKKSLAVAVLTAVLIAVPTWAQMATTLGSENCGEWEKPNNQFQRLKMESWLIGYLSGQNIAWVEGGKKDVLAGISTKQSTLWMDKYCRDNPLSKLRDGGIHLIRELQDNAGKSR